MLDATTADENRMIEEQKRAALEIFRAVWEDGLADGIEPDILANAALFAVFSDLVESYGEEAVAAFASNLGKRIERGEFSLDRRIH
ncbi:MAG: hypothetical protein KDJ16_18580 [Hyphomicrobiales bacterium]|nr:hypothetical protein [Hyphomicrobiales bacterium]